MPKSRALRRLSPFAVLVLPVMVLAGCPVEQGLQCPPGTTSVGQFTLTFAGQHSTSECVAVLPDGGDAGAGPLTLDDAGLSSANLCYGLHDGTNQLALVIPGKGTRYSPLTDGGAFDFDGSTPATSGTACVCPVTISETFAGNLISATPDGGFTVQADGGIPVAAGLTATLKDTLTAGTAGDTSCICATPCSVTYGITGTP